MGKYYPNKIKELILSILIRPLIIQMINAIFELITQREDLFYYLCISRFGTGKAQV